MLREIVLVVALVATPALSQDKEFTLYAPESLINTGFLKYILPRFSLKTSIRIKVISAGADAVFGDVGSPVFRQGDTIWRLDKTDSPDTDAFGVWLQSATGKRTIEAFELNGNQLFDADFALKPEARVISIVGDAAQGEGISLRKCGRCHVINETNRMKAIGSTPSFGLLRTFSDWQRRFETFFMLNPHPAFTQVVDVTEPFAANLPPPIVPIEVTLEEIEAIVAYVYGVTPASLGPPMQSQ